MSGGELKIVFNVDRRCLADPICLIKAMILSAVIPPDYRVASFLRLGDCSVHPLHNRPELSSVYNPDFESPSQNVAV